MKKSVNIVSIALVLLMFLSLSLHAAGGGETPAASGSGPAPVSVVLTLDWVPNTNHIGAYVARELGYFAEEGLEVQIIQPAESSAETLVALNRAQFGYSYQESVTFARTGEDSLPVVAVAAVIQHNSSGFAAPADKGINSVADLAGRRYGGWGSPVESATLETLLAGAGEDPDSVEMVNIGSADFFAATVRDVDFAWVFEGWTMIEAETRGIELSYLDLGELDPVFDYYTPVIIAGEELLNSNPEMAKSFLRALSRGYRYAIENPLEAAEILVEAVPEIPGDLAARSLEFLAPRFQDDAPRWGEMRSEVWQRYADWLLNNGLIARPLDVNRSYSNAYLP